ncbi:MAG TPA: non-ribosomal peptide synthetase, partial [Marmoricola sp.]|nr:non-ribosomal peptide synthetase [Marmoricola sp.]
MVIANYEVEAPFQAPRTSTLASLFKSVARSYPDATAVSVAGEDISYARLDELTDQLADQLRQIGAGPGEYVGVRITSGTLDLYAGILAVLKSGAAYVPVDAEDPEERVRVVFGTADVLAVLTDGFQIEACRAPRITGRELSPESDAWVIFTSGTTGAPKGVAVSHRSAVAFIRAEQSLWEVWPSDRVLAGLSISFDASCEEIWTAWSNGAALVPIPRSVVRSGLEMGPWMRDRNISVVSSVPTLAAMWDHDVLEGVRLLILGGEALPEPLGHHLAQHCEVWNTYGPTEATVVSTAARVRVGEPITIGFALNGWETALIDEDGRPVELGDPGELVIGGVGLGRYLDPKLDKERYAAIPHLGWDRAYRSGDVVRETPDGYAFVGRRDDQVKIGGRRIELGEVDARLAECDGVLASASTVQQSASGNKILVGYVVARTGTTLDTIAIRDQVSRFLSGGIAPLVIQVESLPQKSSGKVDRKALPWPPPESIADDTDLGVTGAWIAQCWTDQLGPLPFSATSNFFHMGGTSLSAARLVNALRERFPGVAISDVYLHPEIADLASHL